MKKSNAKRFSASSDGLNVKRLALSTVFGALFGTGALFLILLVFSAICILISNPHPLIFPLSLFAIYASAFFAGLFTVKKNGSSNALVCGALCGVLFLAIVWILTILIGFISQSDNTTSTPFILKLIIIPLSVLGSFAGTSSGIKKKKRNF